MKALLIAGSYIVAIVIGFALGVYALPILVAPTGLSETDVAVRARSSLYSGQFRRNLKDSDFLHWGEGIVYVGVENITLRGEVSPGPDYKLYLSPEFVETEDEFDRVKPRMSRIGDVRAFKNFSIPVPSGVDVARYNTVIIWCETFHQFISAAKYQ